MKVTVFNAKKTAGKYPNSPYGDDTFLFETRNIDNISDVFDSMVSNFTLNIPLTKNVKSLRRVQPLKNLISKELEYIIIDIDDIDTISDRALALDYFKKSNYEVVLGESRTDYRIKGVLRVNKMNRQEAKEVLKEIQCHVPGVVDLSAIGRVTYQAPIHKHKILYQGGTKKYPKPNVKIVIPQSVQVPGSIEQICINELNKLGFSFDNIIPEGYRCSHFSEIKSPGGFTWSRSYPFNVTHWNPARNVSVWSEVIKTKEYKEYQNQNSRNEVKEIIPTNCINTNKRYLDGASKEVQEFLDGADILRIQSPMGTAKSKIIEEVIHQARKKELKVLFLTNRISLADDIADKYDNIKHYLGTEAEENNYIKGDDLVVQIDSLHKYSTKFFDVVIMDEAATTLMHLLSLEHHQKKIATQILSLSDRKLVLADAFIFDTMVDIFEPKRVIKIINGYRDEVNLKMYTQKDNFILNLIETAKKEPLTFSSGSTQVLKVVKLLLDQNGISNLTISAEIPQTTKQAIFRSFKHKKPKAQVIMYSPSLTVGISNENDTKTHFHFDSGLSMDVLSSLQMVKRTRKAQTIHMYLDERVRYASTNVSQIQTCLTDFKEQDKDGDDIGISIPGVKFASIQKLYNTLENRHKISFISLLSLQFITTPETIEKVSEVVPNFFDRTSKIVKAQEKQEKLDIFEMYKNMSVEKISDIELKLYATSKKDLFIREFEKIKEDETISLSNDNLNKLIEQEIEYPGVIDCYKNNLNNTKIFKNSRNGTYSSNNLKKYNISIKEIKEYGFEKKHSIFILNPLIKELLKEK